ncbi:hypothetical protein GobsT_44510 [Gemmata obscuriglobus]|uniref:Uncharacterized protein n=1 Tax=Gemmata obscuriglobus TaxID=114 RepID=A0A2Z3GY36_9BACT|nr:hypothetical protein [Gemmata obscuriglobus]AWM37561.1 hypothetical protein C1280_11435 [Gemmata obscuriglobus]QEG29653.1 hypothetical protein GobsT_44510 [Gemmata obscuriglobus]VTS08970.1 unnamed protein product [Gemmata obscuriglobus UQM 2246]
MEFSPGTDGDLADIERAADEFRSLWGSLRAMPFPAPFDGGLGDIRALDYLDYESLAYPPGGLPAAALVWGRVLARQSGLAWARCSVGGLWLRAGEPGGQLAVWPLARVAEAQARSNPQDGKYAMLIERVLAECLDGYYGVGEVSERLERLRVQLAGE